MKKQSKNETDLLGYIAKIHAQLELLDRKVNILIEKTMPPKPAPQGFPPKPFSQPNSFNQQSSRPNNNFQGNARHDSRQHERIMHKAICADCKKECQVPFRPVEGRLVYCQSCFSRRKNGISFRNFNNTQTATPLPAPQSKIDTAPAEELAKKNKSVAKKKTAAHKKPALKKIKKK